MDREKSSRPPFPAGRGGGDGLRAALRRLPAYVYLEDILRGRHVLEVGCGDGHGAYHLARSAASVIGLDRQATVIDAARARFRQTNLSFAVADFAAIDLGDEAVDVICVPHGEELARWPAFLDEARRVLARDGVLIVAGPSADRQGGGGGRGIAYHDLLGRLEPLFAPVHMIGVTPFVGFALVEYADTAEILDVELDTSLVDLGAARDTVTDYLAVAGSGVIGSAPRGFMVVELPSAEGVAAVAAARAVEHASSETEATTPARVPPPAPPGRGDDHELRRRLARAIEERSGADAELHVLRARLGEAEEEIGRVAAEAARELGEARHTTHILNARIESLEAQLAETRRTMDFSDGDPAELQRLEAEIRVRDEELATLEARIIERDEELSDLRLEMAPLEVMARAAEQHETEMRARSAELAERDAYVEELRQELEEVAAAEQAAAAAARDASVRAAELEVEVRELRGRLSAAEGELLKLRGRPTMVDPQKIGELEQLVAEKQAAADKAAARWKEAETKTDELWKKIGELGKELSTTREQAVENARMQRQAAQIALTRAVDEASKKLVSAQDQTMRTERERQELEREVLALRPRLAQAEQRVEELSARSNGAELTARLGELEGQLREVEVALRDEEGKVAELGSRLGELLVTPEPPPSEPPPSEPPPEAPPEPEGA